MEDHELVKSREIQVNDFTSLILEAIAEADDDPLSIAEAAQIDPAKFRQFISECVGIEDEDAVQLLKAAESIQRARVNRGETSDYRSDSGRRISTSEWVRGVSVSPDTTVLLKDVRKIFYTDEIETHALSNINLELRRGEYISILGPSGGGKSTLLSIIGLLESPTDGEYILNGTPVANLSSSDRARIRNREIGFIFQAFNLIGDLSVYENVELPLRYREMKAKERRYRVEEALLKVGMSHRMKHYPSQLSGGQQQRVAVARALAGSPSILLADEPTGNLDSTNGEAVMNLLRELHAGGATICMVTHDPRYAKYADRAIQLFDGRIEEELVREEDGILLPHGFY